MKEVTVILKKRKERNDGLGLSAVSRAGSMDLSLPSSDSSYSETNTINRNTPNVATQIESASAEQFSVPGRPHNRKPNWKYTEDIALCQAWVRCSENLIIGTSQTGNSLWNRIFVDFCEKLPETTRTKKSVENRWTTIQDDVTKWKTVVDRVHEDQSSGTNSADEWGVCYNAFREDYKRAFKFYHCWEILHHSEKWNDAFIEKCQGKPNARSDAIDEPPPLASLMHGFSGSSNLSLPSSDSSYFQTDTINPNPPNVATQIESSVPTGPPNRKSLNWRHNEDIALCQAWVRWSQNPVIGINQTSYSMWNWIFEDFCEKQPETKRTKKSLENRWSAIQEDVTKWKVIMNRVHKDRLDVTNSADEWGFCYKAFRDDHKHDFKFYHCWEILYHTPSGNSGKSQDTPFSITDTVNAPPPPIDGVGVDNLHGSNSIPSIDDDSPSPSTPTDPTLSSIPSEPSDYPIERKSVKEKKRCRINTNTSDEEVMQIFECLKLQQNHFQMMQESQQNHFRMLQELQKNQFEDMKVNDERCAFHLVKKIKLEQVRISIEIVQAIWDTEEKMINRAPHLMSDTILDARAARFKTLHDLERKLYEILDLEYSSR